MRDHTKEEIAALHVGARIWVYDTTIHKASNSHWRPTIISGQTTRSWTFMERGRLVKIDKKTGNSKDKKLCLSASILEDHRWVIRNRRDIIAAVSTADAATLRKVGDALGRVFR